MIVQHILTGVSKFVNLVLHMHRTTWLTFHFYILFLKYFNGYICPFVIVLNISVVGEKCFVSYFHCGSQLLFDLWRFDNFPFSGNA